MTLNIILTPPTAIGGSAISMKIERLTYNINREVISAKFSNKDKVQIMDVQGSLLKYSINGIITSISEMQDLITASRTWWIDSAGDSSDVTRLPKIQWRSRSAQYMTIERLEITDYAESDTHEFEYKMEIVVDTRTS